MFARGSWVSERRWAGMGCCDRGRAEVSHQRSGLRVLGRTVEASPGVSGATGVSPLSEMKWKQPPASPRATSSPASVVCLIAATRCYGCMGTFCMPRQLHQHVGVRERYGFRRACCSAAREWHPDAVLC
ncbi:hypothetical protein PSPO01_04090 [Paraphaeosphaeria sporulosa]